MKPQQFSVLLVALCVSGMALAADSGTLTRAETLRAKPFADAKVVAPVAGGSKVSILLRSGGWYQVKAGSKTGWVRMLSVRRSAATSGSSIAGLASVASGRTGTGKVTTTTGVRGLDSNDLATAAFNEAEISMAEQYRVSAKDALAFAKQGRLLVHAVQPLPAPDRK
jgi:uncharacterized protein YgiM (DUF1202 family)